MIKPRRLFLSLLFWWAAVAAAAADGRAPGNPSPPAGDGEPRPFTPVILPPGFVKRAELTLRAEKGTMPILDANGEFTPLARYLHLLARDSRNLEAHFRHLFSSESGNWRIVRSPLFSGPEPANHGHRLPRLLVPYRQIMREAGIIPPAEQARLLTPDWVSAAERMFRSMLNDDGLLARGENVATMALSFHFMRSGWGEMGLEPSRIYTLPKAQALIRTLLTEPHIINPRDQWLAADEAYLAACRKADAAAKYPPDKHLIREGKVFFSGGLFIGWKSTRPSLHATWDALAIINTLFSYYPEPDPASRQSIFHLWHQLPAARQEPGRATLQSLRRKLWLDFQEHRGPTYCFIAGGKPTETVVGRSEAPRLFDHAGYSESDLAHWAFLSWQEMFGDPVRNTNNGVQALLAIIDGRVLREMKIPSGLQKTPGSAGGPGRPDDEP